MRFPICHWSIRFQGLQAERKKRRQPTADANHEELLGSRSPKRVVEMRNPTGSQPNNPGADEIHDQRSVGESFSEPFRNEPGQPEAAHTPDRSANENQDQS